jgi:hypothetical protein
VQLLFRLQEGEKQPFFVDFFFWVALQEVTLTYTCERAFKNSMGLTYLPHLAQWRRIAAPQYQKTVSLVPIWTTGLWGYFWCSVSDIVISFFLSFFLRQGLTL